MELWAQWMYLVDQGRDFESRTLGFHSFFCAGVLTKRRDFK
jgi:hypothetical protein